MSACYICARAKAVKGTSKVPLCADCSEAWIPTLKTKPVVFAPLPAFPVAASLPLPFDYSFPDFDT